MIELKTRIEQMTIESGKRILVTSDIHGHLSYLKKFWKKLLLVMKIFYLSLEI